MLCAFSFAVGTWAAQPATTEVFRGEFMVVEEQQYGRGIQFFALQRVDEATVDRAVCSLDGDLPLAKSLSDLSGKRVRLVLEDASRTTLQRLER